MANGGEVPGRRQDECVDSESFTDSIHVIPPEQRDRPTRTKAGKDCQKMSRRESSQKDESHKLEDQPISVFGEKEMPTVHLTSRPLRRNVLLGLPRRLDPMDIETERETKPLQASCQTTDNLYDVKAAHTKSSKTVSVKGSKAPHDISNTLTTGVFNLSANDPKEDAIATYQDNKTSDEEAYSSFSSESSDSSDNQANYTGNGNEETVFQLEIDRMQQSKVTDTKPHISINKDAGTPELEIVNSKSYSRSQSDHRRSTVMKLKDIGGSAKSVSLAEREENVLSFDELLDHAHFGDPTHSEKLDTEIKTKEFSETQIVNLEDYIDLPSCTNAEVFEDYYVLVYDDLVVKKRKHEKTVTSRLRLPNAYSMCMITQTSDVAVLQMSEFISVVSTHACLQVKYKIKIQKAYSKICHLATRIAKAKQPTPLYVFCAVLTSSISGEDTMVHMIEPSEEINRPKKIYAANTKELKLKGITGVSGIDALSNNSLVLGCHDGIQCVKNDGSRTMQTMWKIELSKAATDVRCTCEADNPDKKIILACIQDEKRVVVVQDGRVTRDNLLPIGNNVKPHRISANGNMIIVKEFNEDKWVNFVHEL